MLSQIENPTSPVILPFEMWLGVMGVALLLVIAIGWLVGNAVRLRKIDRRLKSLEGKPKL
jgi:flagellar biogenesis protein FliO